MIHAQLKGGLLSLTLETPERLNALNLEDLQALHAALDEYEKDEHDNARRAILLKGEGRAFCAGGDVRGLLELDREEARAFIASEYRLIHRIYRSQTPVFALAHGPTMGAGMGLWMASSVRIAEEETAFAMPETAIGLYPDALSGVFLPPLGPLGRAFALSGARIPLSWAQSWGWIHSLIRKDARKEAREVLEESWSLSQSVKAALEALKPLEAEVQFSNGEALRWMLREVQGSLEEVLGAFESYAGEDALLLEMQSRLRTAAPSALVLADAHHFESQRRSLEQILAYETRLSQSVICEADFKEGVTALLIRKDNRPKWRDRNVGEAKGRRSGAM